MEHWVIFRIIWAFALVAVLLFALTYAVRALSRGRLVVAANRKLVTVLESTFLAQNVTLHVIKVGDQFYLVGGGSAGVTKIDSVSADIAQSWLDEQKQGFNGQRDAVMRLMNKFKSS